MRNCVRPCGDIAPRRNVNPLDPDDFDVQPLVKSHPRAAFSCGNASLDRYLHEQARREQERRVARVYVLVHQPTGAITGYHTLSSSSVKTVDLPDDIQRKLPRYEATPVILLGRLARDLGFRGAGIGERLLTDALRRGLEVQTRIGAVTVVVDAIDEPAARFYEAYGFIRFPRDSSRLFIAMDTIEDACDIAP